MERNQTKTCDVCFKTMRGENLKRHIIKMNHLQGKVIRHEQENEDNVVNKEQNISYTSVTDEDLEKRFLAKMKKINIKIEMGRKVELIVEKNRYNVNGLSQNMMEVLKIYKLHGETKEDMYKWTFCDYASRSKYNVKRHEKTMHYYHE